MKEVALTGSQREALCALAGDQDRPWTVGSAFDHASRTIPAPIANLLAKRGLATLSGGMGRRTVSITDVGMAEAASGDEAKPAPSLDVEAMAEAIYEADRIQAPEEPPWAEVAPARAAFQRVRAQMLLKRYHEILRAKREGL